MASRLAVVIPDKPVLQGMGFSCETGGIRSSREKESKVLHLNNMAYTPVPKVKKREETELSTHEYTSEGKE